jgi:transketolase
MKANRFVFGDMLCELAKEDPRIVVVDSDISVGLNYTPFSKEFPDRYFNCGIAEQNMVSVAVGLSTCGLIPFAASFAVFTSMRALDQLRNGGCYNNFNIKVVGTHAGLETGADGATHQSVEDIAIMRSIPNIKVLVPSTPIMTRCLTKHSAYTEGPVYLRFGREPCQELYGTEEDFPIGGSKELAHGNDATIISCGHMIGIALEAAKKLDEKGKKVRVIDMYSIKPVDTEAIVKAARETQGIVTIEDHSVIGGLGGAVCEVVSQYHPAKVLRIGINDVFGRSGSKDDLFEAFGLTVDNLVNTVLSLF